FLHLLQHLQKNDNNILALLSSQNNELFLRYFRSNHEILVEKHLDLFESQREEKIPLPFWKNHIVSTFVETIRWWINTDTKESPEILTDYFLKVV
ncbi:MAG: TetR family transcriptional regulator C-terminal domain-containing protein, partial [Clostridia bacterium]|nr:TetR family transcriptional regulator C-terminal domain-containing protein [Clostridia bacterium]